jgi:hypothetical protein
MTGQTIPQGTVRAHPKGKPVPEGSVSIPLLGYANHATWEEHMEWATRGLPEAEKAAMWEKYGAIRAAAEAKAVTPPER